MEKLESYKSIGYDTPKFCVIGISSVVTGIPCFKRTHPREEQGNNGSNTCETKILFINQRQKYDFQIGKNIPTIGNLIWQCKLAWRNLLQSPAYRKEGVTQLSNGNYQMAN